MSDIALCPNKAVSQQPIVTIEVYCHFFLHLTYLGWHLVIGQFLDHVYKYVEILHNSQFRT